MNVSHDAGDWTRRIIVGTTVGVDDPPAWLQAAYKAFHANVVHEMYPCYFGSQAERRRALYYSFASGGQMEHLPHTLRTFLEVCTNINRDRNNLALFFEPDRVPATHAQHQGAFWRILRYLRDHDPSPKSASRAIDPADPKWEFPFADQLFFVVGISPSYRLHRSRNLGPCLILIFQPRQVFGSGAAEISAATRHIIRNRVQIWDGVPAHPDLNTYGHPGNREWAQYFISDDNSPASGSCPLFHAAERDAGDGEREGIRALDGS